MVGAILGGVAALGSAIYSGVSSAVANNKARELIQKQRNENEAWYGTKMKQDYTARTDVQRAIQKQRELLQEQYDRARATNVVAGGTDAALAAQQKAASQSLSSTMGDLAAGAASYKDNIERQYRAQDAALNQQQAQSQQQAAQAAQAGSQAVNAGINLMGNDIASEETKIQKTKS